MLDIRSLYYLIFSLGNHRTHEKITPPEGQSPKEKEVLTDHLPELDPTSFTEAHHLAKLNLIRQEEKLREDYEFREQAFLYRMQNLIDRKTNWELHDLVSCEENDPYIRRMGATELVNRRDKTAGLTFTWCIITNTDFVLRKICTIGLGELGRIEDLQVLENIKEDDFIYDYAQEAIEKIRSHETSIKVT